MIGSGQCCSITGLPLICFRSFAKSRLQPISPREPLRGSRIWKCQNMTTLRRPMPISRRGSLRRWHSWNPSNLTTLTVRVGHPNPWRTHDEFQRPAYLVHFVPPNFYFHCTTAYDILRHCGVELGQTGFHLSYLNKAQRREEPSPPPLSRG